MGYLSFLWRFLCLLSKVVRFDMPRGGRCVVQPFFLAQLSPGVHPRGRQVDEVAATVMAG